MNMKFLGTFTAAALTLTAMPAFAVTYLDDFSFNQYVEDVPTAGETNSTTVAGTGFLGDTRTLAIKTGPGTGTIQGNPSGAAVFQTFGGNLLFSNEAFTTGTATLQYNNIGDLTLGGKVDGFKFNILEGFDSGAVFNAFATSGGNTISYEEDLDLTSPLFTPFLTFAQFANGDDTFDFANVATLTFTITSNQNQIDGGLSGIELTEVAPVPVPASGLLLLGAFGGVAALRRRKAKKAA